MSQTILDEIRADWSSRKHQIRALVIAIPILFACYCARFCFSQNRQFPTVMNLPPGEALEEFGARPALPEGFQLRTLSQAGIDGTKLSEGWVPHLYNDAVHYCTIGYGHLIKKAPCNGQEPPEFLSGITTPQGEKLLIADLATSQYCVMTSVVVTLSDGQYAALTDFVFNVGSNNFLHSTLLQVVNSGQLDQVPGQFRRWIIADGKALPALAARRNREINLFFSGLPKARVAPPEGERLAPIDIRKGEPAN